MPGVYLDTSLFVALLYTDDNQHDRAIELVKRLIKGDFGKPLHTSSAVVIETTAIIQRNSRGPVRGEMLRRILTFINGYRIDLNFLVKDWIEQATRLYEERTGSLDFVDTLNVTFLRKSNVNQIVSFDGDYDQFSGEGIIRIC